MKIKAGDRVKFLNDTGSGVVVRIVDQNSALVETEDGFEVPWLIRDLVVDKGSYGLEDDESETAVGSDLMEDNSSGSQPRTSSDHPSSEAAENRSFEPEQEHLNDTEPLQDEALLLALLPIEGTAGYELFLINSSSYRFSYIISKKDQGELLLFKGGELEPGLKESLGRWQPVNLQLEEIYRVQGLFYNSGHYRPIDPVNLEVNIDPESLLDAKQRKSSDYFHEKAIFFTLYDWLKAEQQEPGESPLGDQKSEEDYTIDPGALKDALLTKGDVTYKKVEKPVKPTQVEVDLHIEELIDDHRGLSNGEILEIQLDRFKAELADASTNKVKRVIFIHGVGNGKLKLELRRILDREYKKLRYQDASFKEYGYGATMVILS